MTLIAGVLRQMIALGAARLRVGLTDLALIVAIGVCLATAAGFGLSALHGLLRPLVGPAGASALLAVLLVIVALALALWLSVRRNASSATPQSQPLPVPVAETQADAAPPADLGTSAAFLAGFLLARRL